MDQENQIEWVAVRVSTGWVIRPRGTLGTCGWVNGVPWTAHYVKRKPSHIPEER